jgi:hypothetical protein
MKTNLNHIVLSTVLCLVFTAEVRAQLPNSWQINDNLTTVGFIQYITNLTNPQYSAAVTYGWRFTLVSRMVSDSGGSASQSIAFGTGSKRFYIFFDLDSSGRLTAQLLGDTNYTLTSAADGTNYHTHELLYDPATSNATYGVDGVTVASWTGQASTGQSNQVMWGANSSTGRGVMNYQHVEFEIATLGIVAAYNAGYDGNPATAPSPTTLGWTRFTSGSAIPETPVSPDAAPLFLRVTTLPASEIVAAAARLNALITSYGLPADCYFEYGTTTNYGNVTPTNAVTPGIISTLVSNTLSGLESATVYHFRAVALGSNGSSTGEDLSLNTSAFSNVQVPGLPGIEGVYAWGDYDNDGRLDLLLAGFDGVTSIPVSQLWRNTGTGFTNVTDTVVPGVPGVINGCVAWGDYDNDGRLDFLISGRTNQHPSEIVSQLWRNTGQGFSNVTASAVPGLPWLMYSHVAWGDYDNDGRLDFLITGWDRVSNFSQLWRNMGGWFSNVTDTVAPGLPQIYGAISGNAAWGDYDNDGRLDLLLTGYAGDLTNSVSQLWRNTGNGFSNVTDSVTPGLLGVSAGSVAWGDYDHDGRLDFILIGNRAGQSAYDFVSQIWRNSGTGFSNVTMILAPALPTLDFGCPAWGDFDNDGLLDFFITGRNQTLEPTSQLWRNTGSGFTNMPFAGLSALWSSSVAWADYDNDGALDFITTGFSGSLGTGDIVQLWRNNTHTTNTSPTAPTGLAMTTFSNGVLQSWNAATDAETPSTGLSYNVRAGTTPGGTDLLATQANPITGFRRVPALGNAQMRHFLPLAGVTNGQTVYWSVQAVDTAFAGGPFAAETSVVSIPQIAINPGGPANAIVSWIPPTWGWRLQENTNLSASAWSDAPSGETNPVGVTVTSPTTFYRVHKP